MQKRRILWIVVLSSALSLSFTHPAYGYIDPGTTGSIFGMLAPFIAIFLAFLGFLIRPVRVFFVSLFYKLRGKPETETETVDSPEEEENVESIVE